MCWNRRVDGGQMDSPNVPVRLKLENVLLAIDFYDSARAAGRYAATIAIHYSGKSGRKRRLSSRDERSTGRMRSSAGGRRHCPDSS
jgi:hypothetical protein